jgi:hypothetical protein
LLAALVVVPAYTPRDATPVEERNDESEAVEITRCGCDCDVELSSALKGSARTGVDKSSGRRLPLRCHSAASCVLTSKPLSFEATLTACGGVEAGGEGDAEEGGKGDADSSGGGKRGRSRAAAMSGEGRAASACVQEQNQMHP